MNNERNTFLPKPFALPELNDVLDEDIFFDEEISAATSTKLSELAPEEDADIDTLIRRHIYEFSSRKKQLFSFVMQGLPLVAQRIQRELGESDDGPIRTSFDEVFNSVEAKKAQEEGMQGGGGPSGRFFRDSAKTVSGLVAEHIGRSYAHTPLMNELTVKRLLSGPDTGFARENVIKGFLADMDTAGLPDAMRAVLFFRMAIYYAHAVTRSRMLALLSSPQSSRIVKNEEGEYWKHEMIGTPDKRGILFYLGYRLGAMPLLREKIEQLFPEFSDMAFDIVDTVPYLRTKGLKREDVQSMRVPILQALARNDCQLAIRRLLALNDTYPGIIRQSLLKKYGVIPEKKEEIIQASPQEKAPKETAKERRIQGERVMLERHYELLVNMTEELEKKNFLVGHTLYGKTRSSSHAPQFIYVGSVVREENSQYKTKKISCKRMTPDGGTYESVVEIPIVLVARYRGVDNHFMVERGYYEHDLKLLYEKLTEEDIIDLGEVGDPSQHGTLQDLIDRLLGKKLPLLHWQKRF